MKVRGQPVRVGFPFHSVSPRDQFKVHRLSRKYLYLLSHLIGSWDFLIVCYKSMCKVPPKWFSHVLKVGFQLVNRITVMSLDNESSDQLINGDRV